MKYQVWLLLLVLAGAGCLEPSAAPSPSGTDETDGPVAGEEQEEDTPETPSPEAGPDDGRTKPHPTPVHVTMTDLAVVNIMIPIEQVEHLVVPGARPCAAPCLPINNEVREEPTGSIGVAQMWAIRYSAASVDGSAHEAGTLGMLTLSVRPVDVQTPVESHFYYQPLMIAGPEELLESFTSWGVPVADTKIHYEMENTTPAWLVQTTFAGGGFDVEWAVGGSGVELNTVARKYVFLTGDAEEFQGFFIWHEAAGHHGSSWPIPVVGSVGSLGELATAGFGEIAFFGDGPPKGAEQVWEYVPPDDA